MDKVHKLKLSKDFCDAVLDGIKTFEIRYNDRGYQKGDFIKFIPVDSISSLATHWNHPIENALFEITYVINGWGLKDDFVCLAIKLVNRNVNKKEYD